MHTIKNQNQLLQKIYFKYINKNEMTKYSWLTKESREFLSRGYLREGVSAEERIREIAEKAESILSLPGFADKLEDYASRGWISFSTPVWANFGHRGLPISCFGSVADDTMEGILFANSEIGMMSKHGGGTSLYLGDIRPRGSSISSGGTADGPVHFAKLTDTMIDVAKQADTRRGSCAVYLPVEHQDIEEFLQIKHEGNPIQNLQFGVTITDSWMESMIDGDKQKRKIWAKIISSRSDIGFPYILFLDNANSNAPDIYKQKGKKIVASNLCNEIMLSSDKDESFVCCLSSINLFYFDEWKDTDLVQTMIFFLDAIMTEFIDKAKNIPFMERSVRFAESQRALGLGVLGWHSYLQSKMIPIESMEAKLLNTYIFKSIRQKADLATGALAKMYGEPELLVGMGRRNATTLAVAPTKSSSFILGQVSMGIEPIKSNYFIKDLAKSKTVYKNPQLLELLKSKDKDTKEVWDSILLNNGSVQHLSFLTDHEKMVFKTFVEISQLELVQQNAARQKYVDQGISFNLSIHPSVPAKDINQLYIQAWESGIKGLYYQFSENSAMAFARNILDCVSCES
jgi:ribonucleoside-diphosphate reductase alpha chain